MPDDQQVSLIEYLPAVRGELTAEAPVARFTWFKTGGPAEVLFRPADKVDLACFLAGTPSDVSITVIGNASNLLVRDGGIDLRIRVAGCDSQEGWNVEFSGPRGSGDSGPARIV